MGPGQAPEISRGTIVLRGGKISESDLSLLVSDDIDEISAHLAEAPTRPRRDLPMTG